MDRRAHALLLAALLVCAPRSPVRAQEASRPPARAPEAPLSTQAPQEAETTASDKEAARSHFEKGLELIRQKSYEAALAEFRRSRELYPTRAATRNAGFCLRQLGRYVEALAMYEAHLREFRDDTPEDRLFIQQVITELRALVGTIEIAGGEPGAAITIDGRSHGDYPAVDALRVAVGSHVVRLYKEGFEPFETAVEVAGGETARVRAKLRHLTTVGRLKVVERSGRTLDVVVDNVVVGKTPWEGPLAVGQHLVFLRGEGALGTQPVSASVRSQDVAALTLAAEKLSASLLVDASPAGATLIIDAVTVGRGTWEGRLREGLHRVEVAAEGFFPEVRQVTLAADERRVIAVELKRDADAAMWRLPSKIVIELGGAGGLLPTLGGDIVGGCDGACSSGVGAGYRISLRGAYELPSGISFGVAAGYFRATQTVEGRATTVVPVGYPGQPGTAADELKLSGALVGAEVGFRIGQRIGARLGAGALLGSARDERSGTFSSSAGTTRAISPLSETQPVYSLYLEPEARLLVPLTPQLEVGVGLGALFLIAFSQPRWDGSRLVDVGDDGVGAFASESLIGRFMVMPSISAAARYSF
jgi:hypothetical protein